MEKPNSNLQIETLIQNNDFQKGYKGMLFRKKKHNEIKNIQINNNTSDKTTKSNYKEPTPTLSSKQYRPVPVNNTLQNEINNNIKVKLFSDKIMECWNLKRNVLDKILRLNKHIEVVIENEVLLKMTFDNKLKLTFKTTKLEAIKWYNLINQIIFA